MFDPKAYQGKPLASLLARLDGMSELPPPEFDDHRIDVEPVAFGPGPLLAPASDAVELPSTTYRFERSTVDNTSNDVEIPNVDLLEFIASGAFGWVFAARVRTTGLTVAVKVLRNDYAEAGGIAAREALVAASLRHRGILRIFDVSSTTSYWVIVMELVRGKGIDRLPLEAAATMAQLTNLASCLQHMSDRGIVHRDIKPSNIIVRDSNSSPVIIDFGLAVNLATYVHDDVVAGTHYYMSPECLRGERPSPSFDAYSLGVTFCYLLLEKKWPVTIADVKAKLNGRFESELRTRIDSAKQPELAEYASRLIDVQPTNRLEAIRELADQVGDDELAECA